MNTKSILDRVGATSAKQLKFRRHSGYGSANFGLALESAQDACQDGYYIMSFTDQDGILHNATIECREYESLIQTTQ